MLVKIAKKEKFSIPSAVSIPIPALSIPIT